MTRWYCNKCNEELGDEYGPCVFSCPSDDRPRETPRICPWEGSTNFKPNGVIFYADWKQSGKKNKSHRDAYADLPGCTGSV